jgi:hypothetical protein
MPLLWGKELDSEDTQLKQKSNFQEDIHNWQLLFSFAVLWDQNILNTSLKYDIILLKKNTALRLDCT